VFPIHGVVAQVAQTFRLDIELGRLELAVHPDMAKEDLLVRFSCHAP
jgi:hypothetical protein